MLTINKLAFLTLMSFSIYACNGSSNNTNTKDSGSNPTDRQTTNKVPTKIDFELPEALKLKKNKFKQLSKKIRDNNQSKAFKLLKEKIAETKNFSDDIKIQFILVNEVLSDIQKKCKQTVTTICKIPASEIMFDVNQVLIKKLITIDQSKGQTFAAKYENKTYLFGKIEYSTRPNSNEFQYLVKTPNVDKVPFTLQWSKDLKLINAKYSIDNDVTKPKSFFSHTYKVTGKVESLTIKNSNSTYSFDLNLSKLNDTKNTFTLASKYDYLIPTTIDGYTKTEFEGKVDNIKGFLRGTEYIGNNQLFFDSIEYFDPQGQVDHSIYCDQANSGMCDFKNQSTWLENTYPITYIDNLPLNIVNKAFEQGGSLETGITFYLLPSSTPITNLTPENIETLSVGTFTADFPGDFGDGFKQLIHGFLHDLEYQDKLDKLDVYYVDQSISKLDTKDLIISLKR